jgi:cold shock CspA family protein
MVQELLPVRGFVKRFDLERGIGIITAFGTRENLPVISNDILSGYSLAENDRVSFAVRESHGRRFATNVSSDTSSRWALALTDNRLK